MTQSCPHCSAENRDTAQFCAQCAQPLRQPCPQCGADNPARARFCNKCGASLAQEVRCIQCGWVNPSGSRFCNGCGALLAMIGSQPAAPPLSPPLAAGTKGWAPPLAGGAKGEAYPPAGGMQGGRYPPGVAVTGTLAPQFTLGGRYVILRRVGGGGMGAIYQAADNRIPGKTWAIKEMSDTAITNPLEKEQALVAFRQEAMLLAHLDHPNLPNVTDHFTEGGKQYLVMDFVEGMTLTERLEQAGGGPLPMDEVLHWARQLCDVLAYLHNQSPPIIFRDLKPGNVMVTPDGTVKLIDFGIARLFKPGKRTDTAFFGTAGYAPKEQYGKGQTDARSDVYALGATLHHLLTGQDPVDHPFDFEDLRSLDWGRPAHADADGRHPIVRASVADVIMKALAEDPADRWPTVTEMRAHITLAEGPPERWKEPAPEPKPAQEPKRRPKVSATPQPAAVSASVGAVVTPEPIPRMEDIRVPATSRLNFWRGLLLTLLGAVISGGGWWLTSDVLEGYADFPLTPLAFVPALFGVLFGPWVGGLAGALGSFAHGIYSEDIESGSILALGVFILGFLPGLMVKEARKWKAVVGAGIVASSACALSVATTLSIVQEYWNDFGEITVHMLILILPSNALLLPLFARWLAGLARQRELSRQDRH